MNEDDIFLGHGVEIYLNDKDDFLKIKETLTRIGIASRKDNTLFQSCHILHKKGKYAIVHFKELFSLDGKFCDITENDISRRNAIAKLLEDWELLSVVYKEDIEDVSPFHFSQIKILSHKEKKDWILTPKYNIGTKKNN
jgi:hypothetical protein